MSDWEKSTIERNRLALTRTDFGIPYLDDALQGILSNDLIVLAAETGVGKTEIATMIATHNAKKGKGVSFYALEAAKYEIHNRITFQYIAKYFFAHRRDFPPDLHLDYRSWEMGAFDEWLDPIFDKVLPQMQGDLAPLEVFTPTVSEFTKEDFADIYREEAKHASIVILDHLHYLWWDNENEYSAIKNAMVKLRDLVNEIEVPIILISHLRKEDRGNQSLVPTYHELHGSSEISKRANAVITFGPAFAVPNHDGEQFECPPGMTFVRICKARSSSKSTTRYIALINYDLSNHTYENSYVPFRTNRMATTIDALAKNRFERWMKHGKELGE